MMIFIFVIEAIGGYATSPFMGIAMPMTILRIDFDTAAS